MMLEVKCERIQQEHNIYKAEESRGNSFLQISNIIFFKKHD